MTLLEDIILYLAANDLVTADGEDCFRNFTPDKPDNIVILYEYSGLPTVKGVECATRSVQVNVRDNNPTTCEARSRAIYEMLDDPLRTITDLTDTRWSMITANQPPFKLEIDAAQRAVWTFNLTIVTSRN